MKYRYETEQNKLNVTKTFKIVETVTENIVKYNLTFDSARKLSKHLNNYGGFAGFTPSFFLHSLITA